MLPNREIFFHEDNYCQQQLLPGETAGHAESELKHIDDFSQAHRAPGGLGWTDIYVRKEAPVALQISKAQIDNILVEFLPRFDSVFTGYGSSYSELCENTSAWGKSPKCVLFANWNEAGIVRNIWTSFFDRDEESISAAVRAVTWLAKLQPLVYVDWAWGYTCDASDAITFASKLRDKLAEIAASRIETRLPEP